MGAVGEGKGAKGDYSKYQKLPPGTKRSNTPERGAPPVRRKVISVKNPLDIWSGHCLELR